MASAPSLFEVSPIIFAAFDPEFFAVSPSLDTVSLKFSVTPPIFCEAVLILSAVSLIISKIDFFFFSFHVLSSFYF